MLPSMLRQLHRLPQQGLLFVQEQIQLWQLRVRQVLRFSGTMLQRVVRYYIRAQTILRLTSQLRLLTTFRKRQELVQVPACLW